MRAIWVWCIAVLLVIRGRACGARKSQRLNPRRYATCPTVLPETAGERSVVVPTLAPQVATPRVASRPTPAVHAAQSLLSEKLAERDRLQREISALQEPTKTPEQILVRVKMMEVNLTKLRQRGIDWAALASGTVDSTALESFDALDHQNLGKVLAKPSVVTTSGRPASICVGGEFPVPMPAEDGGVKIQKYGTQLDVMAIALGDNKVRLNVRPRVSELDASRGIVVAGQQVPALTVRECDFSSEMEFGKSVVLSGLVQERTEDVRRPVGPDEQRGARNRAGGRGDAGDRAISFRPNNRQSAIPDRQSATPRERQPFDAVELQVEPIRPARLVARKFEEHVVPFACCWEEDVGDRWGEPLLLSEVELHEQCAVALPRSDRPTRGRHNSIRRHIRPVACR